MTAHLLDDGRVTERGTLLGDPLSMWFLTSHQLTKVEAATILYRTGKTLATVTAQEIDEIVLNGFADPGISSVLGDDLISISPQRWIVGLDSISEDAGDLFSPGKDYLSEILEPGVTAQGIFLEEIFSIQRPDNRRLLNFLYEGTLKLRLMSDMGPPSGPDPRQQTTVPVFSRILAVNKTLQWREGSSSSNVICKIMWEVFPKVKAMRDDYPVFMPEAVGGMAMPTWGGWVDIVDLTPDWFLDILYQACFNKALASLLRNIKDIDEHQVRVCQSVVGAKLPEPYAQGLIAARDRLIRERPETLSEQVLSSLCSTSDTRGVIAPNYGGITQGCLAAGLINGPRLAALVANGLGQVALYRGDVKETRFTAYTLDDWKLKMDKIRYAFHRETPIDRTDFANHFCTKDSLGQVLFELDHASWYDASDKTIATFALMSKSVKLPRKNDEMLRAFAVPTV